MQSSNARDPLDADYVGKFEESEQKLEGYLDRLMKSPDFESTVEITLKQLGQGSENEIEVFDLSPGDDAAELSKEIVARAMDDGRNSGARNATNYLIRIGGRGGRCTFTLNYPAGDPSATNEAPTDRGGYALVLRHQEVLFQNFIQMAQTTNQMLRDENQAKDARLHHLETMQVSCIKLFAELHDSTHKHKMELRKAEKNEELLDEVGGFLMQGIPAVMNKFLGQGAVAEPTTPVEMQLEGFLRALKPDQYDALLKSGELKMNKTQLMGFLEMLNAFQNARAARAEPTVEAAGDETVVDVTPEPPAPPAPSAPKPPSTKPVADVNASASP